jgi:phosphoglycerate dehydrogenase-like enzyme
VSAPDRIVAVEHVNTAASMRAVIAAVRERGYPVTVVSHPDEFTQRLASIRAAEVLLVSTAVRIGRPELEALPRLRGVTYIASGTNSIDLAAATERGVVVAHAPVVENYESMAEATIMLMLAALYDLARSQRLLRDGWQRPAAPYARMLRGKTVGLIGFGAIAQAVATRLSAWHAEMLYTARHAVAGAPARYVTLEELIAASDVVSIHVPLSDATANLIDADRLQRFKRGAILINTSRGRIVDEDAVASALASGRLGGAAIDVFASEPIEPGNALLDAPGAILTPHIAGHSVEANEALIAAGVENIIDILEGRRPRYVRNPDVMGAAHPSER